MIYLQLSLIFPLDFQVTKKFNLTDDAIEDIEFDDGRKR